jgi:hypothetical protein
MARSVAVERSHCRTQGTVSRQRHLIHGVYRYHGVWYWYTEYIENRGLTQGKASGGKALTSSTDYGHGDRSPCGTNYLKER